MFGKKFRAVYPYVFDKLNYSENIIYFTVLPNTYIIYYNNLFKIKL